LLAALRFYQNFVKQRGDDPAFRAAQGRAFLLLGRINAELGAAESQAIAQYHMAAAVFDKLAKESPDNAAHQQDLALVHYYLGRAYQDLGDGRKCDTSLEAARKLQKALVDRAPEQVKYRREFARTWCAIGEAIFSRNKFDPKLVRQAYDTALNNLVLVFQGGAKAADLDLRAAALHGLAALDSWQGQFDPARAKFDQAMALRQKLVKENPSVSKYQEGLAKTYYALGILENRQSKAKESQESFRKSLEIRERLVAEHPGVTRLAVDVAWTCLRLGESGTSPPPQRLASLTQAVHTSQGVLKSESRHLAARRVMENAYMQRGRLLSNMNRHEEALADWKQFESFGDWKRYPAARSGYGVTLAHLGRRREALAVATELEQGKVNGWLAFDLARLYGLCAQACQKDMALPEAERTKQANADCDHAVALLTQCRATGYLKNGNVGKMLRQNPAFDPLRPRADFQKLLDDGK
jgi:tetratricopeptide (TPR) repeat protein